MAKIGRVGTVFIVLSLGGILLIAWWRAAPGQNPASNGPEEDAGQIRNDLPVIAPSRPPDTVDVPPTEAPAHGTGRVSVHATHRDGAAASGVDVSLAFHEGHEDAPAASPYAGVTDDAGQCSFEGLPWGNYRLFGKAEELSAYANVDISERRPHEVVDLILKPARTIEVEVKDIHRSPIEGARVRALNANFHNETAATARSDVAGVIQLADLPISLYVLQIESEGYAAAQTPPVAVGEPRFTVTLTKGGAIAGQIRTASGGYPDSAVTLSLEPEHLDDVRYEVESDRQGKFLREQLPEGSVKIHGSDAVFALVPAVTFATVSANRVTHIDLTISEGAKVSGTVLDYTSGEPVKGAIVSVFAPDAPEHGWHSEPTGDAGRYEVSEFPPGSLSVQVTLVPLPYSIFALPAALQIELAPGEAAEDIDIAIDTGNMLCGIVLDEQGLPCAQARVALGRVHPNAADAYRYENTNCDRDGRFCFPDVNFARIAGNENPLVSAITLTANSRGLRSDTLRIPLDDGAALNDIVLVLKVRPAGVVAGTVVDELGRPALARVWLRPPEQTAGFDSRSVVNDVDGRFLFQDIAPGNYVLWLAPEPGARAGSRIPGREFTLRPDERLTDLRLVLSRGGEITGRVTTEQGEPLRGIRVDAIGASDLTGDDISSAVTDSDGYFTLINLPNDEGFEVMQSRSAPGARWSVDARSGDNLDIVLPQGTVDDIQPADEALWLYEREFGRPLKVPQKLAQ